MNILFGSDFHCGERRGITPPGFEEGEERKYHDLQKLLWETYMGIVADLPPIDWFVLLGDLIHGKDSKDSGHGVHINDLREQAEMAIIAIEQVEAQNHVLVYGTQYHVTSNGEDIEDVIADYFGIPNKTPWRGDHIFPVLETEDQYVQADLKHKLGCSSHQASRHRALSQEMEFAKQWFLEEVQPFPEILARAHCHYYAEVRGNTGGDEWLAISIPGLQGLGSRYGARICTGVVHFGMVLVTITEEGRLICEPKLARVQSANTELF
jgi:hypothetical protein